MTTESDTTVPVNFEIDRRDLFRVSMELAKSRLLVAIILVAVLIGGLVYFFLLIGEGEMLMKTSPLFVGIPLIAWGGQILRLHAFARKYVAGLTESQRQFRFTFTSGRDGYDLIRGDSSSYTSWTDVLRVSEKPAHFLIYLNRFEAGILPKRGFRPVDIPTFRELVRSKLGVRAQVA